MDQAAQLTIIRTYQQPLANSARQIVKRTIFQRLHAKDENAVADFIREHGGEIWEFSKLHTRSIRDAETLSREIFQDIWIFADWNGNTVTSSEDLVVQNIAMRTLIKHKWQAMTQF